jgi:hypothetical protein
VSDQGYISVKVLRTESQIYAKLDCQLDKMSNEEASKYGGAAPFMRYWCFIQEDVTVLADDVLVDLNNTDPKTGKNTVYTAVSDGETFDDLHTEIVVDKVRGT